MKNSLVRLDFRPIFRLISGTQNPVSNTRPVTSARPHIILFTIGIVLTDRVSKQVLLAWPPVQFGAFDQYTWPNTVCTTDYTNELVRKNDPPLQFWRGAKRKGAGVGEKSAHWVLDMRPGRTARTMSRLIATVDNNKKGQFTLLLAQIAYCPCVKQLGYYTILALVDA